MMTGIGVVICTRPVCVRRGPTDRSINRLGQPAAAQAKANAKAVGWLSLGLIELIVTTHERWTTHVVNASINRLRTDLTTTPTPTTQPIHRPRRPAAGARGAAGGLAPLRARPPAAAAAAGAGVRVAARPHGGGPPRVVPDHDAREPRAVAQEGAFMCVFVLVWVGGLGLGLGFGVRGRREGLILPTCKLETHP